MVRLMLQLMVTWRHVKLVVARRRVKLVVAGRQVKLVVARRMQQAIWRRRRSELEGGRTRRWRRYVVVARRGRRKRMFWGMAATFGRVGTALWRVLRRRLQLVIGRLDLQQILVMLGVRVALAGLGLPFARFAFGGAAAGFLGAATELMAVEIGSHRCRRT